MNKHLTLLAAGTMLALAACNTGTDHGAGTMTQAQIDSTVSARTAEQEARIQRNNDSLINATAQMKADSMMNASKSGGMQSGGAQAGTVGGRKVGTTTKVVRSSGNGGTKSGSNNQTTTTTTTDGKHEISKQKKEEQKKSFDND